MHRLWPTFALGLGLLVNPVTAHAQFSIEPVLDRGPIRFGVGIEVELTRFGSAVATSATASAVLRNAQNIVLASLPQLNKRLLCPNGQPNAAITNLELASPFGTSELALNVLVLVRECSVGLYEGDVRISAPISVSKQGRSVVLAVGPLTIDPQVYAAGFLRVSDSKVSSLVTSKVTPMIAGTVKRLNDWVTSKLREPSLQKFMRQYSLEIQTPHLAMKSGDLALAVTLTGQMSIAEADRRLASLLSGSK